MARRGAPGPTNRIFDHCAMSFRRAVDYASVDGCGPTRACLTMNFVKVSFDHQPKKNENDVFKTIVGFAMSLSELF
jgi:hypothetical protein